MKKYQLRRALEILTEGAASPDLPKRLLAEADDCRNRELPWTTESGVRGFGIARRVTGGERLKDLVLKVYVRTKLRTGVDNPAPKEVRVPGVDEPVPIDVEEIGNTWLEAHQDGQRPARPGTGISHVGRNTGTFGCLVQKNNDAGELYILSNAHVIATFALATPPGGIVNPGEFIVHPGVEPGGGTAPGDVIAELSEVAPLQTTATGFPNRMDAAIARVITQNSVRPEILDMNVIPTGDTGNFRQGTPVQICGSSSEISKSKVESTDFRIDFEYNQGDGTFVRVGLRNQVLCEPYTLRGDSGSIVLNDENEVLGLHLGACDRGSIFTPIGPILEWFDISVVTQPI